MSLFSALQTPTSARQKPLSKGISAGAIQRRIHRLLSWSEAPLIVMYNWKFYRHVSTLRRRSQQQQTGRRFHFLIKELNDEDRLTIAMESGVSYPPEFICNVLAQNPLEAHRNQQLLSLAEDRLQKRLSQVDRDEHRAIEEAKERYTKQRNWLKDGIRQR